MKVVTTAEKRPALTHTDISFEMQYPDETYEDQEVLDLILPCLASRFVFIFPCFQ